MRHRYISYFAGIFLLAFFAVLNTRVLISVSGFQRLQKPVVSQPDFRRQPVSETMQVYLKQAADPGRDVGLYWMATDFENRRFPGKVSPSGFQKLYSQWRNQTGWDAYVQSCRAIWNDVKYFPIRSLWMIPRIRFLMLIPGCLNEITEENGGMRGQILWQRKIRPGIILL